ncbi:hypothetical protein [Methanobrevibacter sp.]|uniref:hypothetical protein n=1 Tax=Methanobrevibacter sp. TaxID=66852 RepID=UPI00388DA0A0
MENKNYLYIDSSEDKVDKTRQSRFVIPKTNKIDYLIGEENYSEALSEIEKTLKKDDVNYWLLKSEIYDRQNEYEKSIDSINHALNIDESDEIKTSKANTLYKWAKVSYFPELEYEKALEFVENALEILPESEDPSEFYFLKGEILEALREPVEARKAYLIAYKEFDKLEEFENQVEYLNTTEDTLISISGSYFYNFTPSDSMIVDLVKEDDNEHDPDAIAVYYKNEKIGYVANSDYTLIDEVKSASKIKNSLNDNAQAKILFVYLDQYIIAKVL